MVETSFNLFDVIILTIVGLSALLSFFRGFIREFLSLGAWVGASIVTLYAFPDVSGMMEPWVKSPVIASGLAAMGVFMMSLLVISVFNAMLMRFFRRGKDVGMLDNGLGLIFGVIRACALLSLGYFIFSLVMSEKDFPDWLAQSKMRPYVESGAILLAKLAPDYLDDISPLNQSESDEKLEETLGVDGKEIGKVLEKDGKSSDESDDYEWMDVEELERLIENAPEQ